MKQTNPKPEAVNPLVWETLEKREQKCVEKVMGREENPPSEKVRAYWTAVPSPGRDYRIRVYGEGSDAVADSLARGIKGAADICKADPPVCVNNLGIPRKKMPQLDEETSQRFLQHFRDKGVKVDQKSMHVGDLKATQRGIDTEKVVSMARSAVDGNFPKISAPVIVSRDNYILDGHHRWAALLTLHPDNQLQVYQVDVPIRQLLQAAGTPDKPFPGVTFRGMREKNPMTSPHQGDEMFVVSGPYKGHVVILTERYGDDEWVADVTSWPRGSDKQDDSIVVSASDLSAKAPKETSSSSKVEYVVEDGQEERVFDSEQKAKQWAKKKKGARTWVRTTSTERRSINPSDFDFGDRVAQTLLFPKDKFSAEQAVDWALEHGTKPIKGDPGGEFYSLRLVAPHRVKPDSYGTHVLPNGVQIRFGQLVRKGNPVGVVPVAQLVSAVAGAASAIGAVL